MVVASSFSSIILLQKLQPPRRGRATASAIDLHRNPPPSDRARSTAAHPGSPPAALANPIPAIRKRNCSMELVAQILAGSGAKNLVYNLEATAASLSSSSGRRSLSQYPPHRRITMLIYSYQSVYMVVAFSIHHCSIFFSSFYLIPVPIVASAGCSILQYVCSKT